MQTIPCQVTHNIVTLPTYKFAVLLIPNWSHQIGYHIRDGTGLYAFKLNLFSIVRISVKILQKMTCLR